MGLATIFVSVSIQFGLPPGLLSSLCYVESKHNVAAIHHDDGGTNSVGVCQIKLKTAKWLGFRGTEKQLMDPSINIYYAGKYLAKQLHRYTSIQKAVIAYNIGNAKNLTTSKYQAKVFKRWELVKISLADLKKAITEIEKLSHDTHVNIQLIDNMSIGFKDKYAAQVEITLYEDSRMLPKIRKDTIL